MLVTVLRSRVLTLVTGFVMGVLVLAGIALSGSSATAAPSASTGLGSLVTAVPRSFTAPVDKYNTGPIVRGDGHLDSGAVIRFDPRLGVYVHANASHTNRGIRKVYLTTSGNLRVEHYKAPVVTMTCAADETVGGERGILVGLSGGGGLTEVRFFDTRLGRNLDLNRSTDYARIASAGSNIWCSWLQIDPDGVPELKK